MEGCVEKSYVFCGAVVPGKFFDDVYTPTREAKHLKVLECRPDNWGDDTVITVSADSEDTIDHYLKDWAKHLEKDGEGEI